MTEPTLPPRGAVSATAPTLPPVASGSAPTQPPPSAGSAPTQLPGMSPAGPQSGGAEAQETGPLAPGQSFGRRYHIKRLLGLGGMGAVYQGWDTELSVDVAIKLIRPDIIADPAAAAEIQRRFKRELLLARLVSHRNVVRIHDLGEIDGIKYITMSYVDGTDLASVLARDGALGVQRALLLARRICDGLVAAHAAGVVHRDLKPANVMVGNDDEALITDFGIARLSSDMTLDAEPGTGAAGSGAPGSGEGAAEPARPKRKAALGARYGGMTRLGSMVGTVEYMPPEQARGDPVDQRADVYALGLMLYDMLAGPVRRESSPSALSELDARGRALLPRVRERVPGVPPALDAIIDRCVRPDPAERFQSSAELAAALARLDEDGKPLPVIRTVGLPRVIAAAAVLLVAVGSGWWYLRPKPPPAAHAPVSVVIADLANRTGDANLDRTLEPVFKLALEGANFISAYAHSDVRRSLGLQPPENFDARAAGEIAVKQGLGVVVAGAIERAGARYQLDVTATQAVTGKVIAHARDTAGGREELLAVAGKLAGKLREALGGDSSDATQRFAMETLTATSLEVVHEYAVAMDALASSRFEAARDSFAKAVAADQNFGLAYAGLAIASSNLGSQQDAARYAKEAVRHVDRMTERERFRTRGLYYYVTADYPSCVKEYGALVARYRADAAARNNLALCYTRLRDMPKALAEMREAVAVLPNRALYRVNLALYAAYAGNFTTAETEAARAKAMSPFGFVPLGFAQLGLGRFDDVRATYAEFAQVNALGASHAAAGLGDLAILEGRYAEAVKILEQGAAADTAAGNPDRAAAKLAALAYAELARGRKPAALAAAKRALALASATVKIRFLAARIFALAGDATAARKLADGLGAEFQAEPRAYAKIVEGELALARGDARAAITALGDANTLLDTWIGRFTLGRAYLEAGAFTQADSEFDRCESRSGEALALFLDEEPTFAFYAPLDYYRGRVREGLGTAGFADAYRRYLDRRGPAGEDPLLKEIRRRIGS
jgi:serine/threonine protein kinase/tetratricopeptide (TPR) repeat protein